MVVLFSLKSEKLPQCKADKRSSSSLFGSEGFIWQDMMGFTLFCSQLFFPNEQNVSDLVHVRAAPKEFCSFYSFPDICSSMVSVEIHTCSWLKAVFIIFLGQLQEVVEEAKYMYDF